MEQINKYILEKAIEADICKPWAVKIAGTNNIDDLLAMYVKGIDFCLEKNFPSNADLVRLGGDKLRKYGIYVDTDINGSAENFTVLLGACKADLHADGYSAIELYVKHTSALNILTTDHAFVMIDCFDDTAVNVEASGNSRVVINMYGKASVMYDSIGNGLVKIVHKNKTTY